MTFYHPQAPFWLFVHKFLRQRFAVGAFIVLLLIMGVGIFGPWIAPYDPHRPVTVQYADRGIDVTQLTRHTLEVEGILSDGSRLAQSELPQLEVATDNRRIANILRTRTGVNVIAQSAGHTRAYVESGDVSSALDVRVVGEVMLREVEPGIAQLRILAPDLDVSPDSTHQLELQALRTDGTELTSFDAVFAFAEEHLEPPEPTSASGFQTSAVESEPEALVQWRSLNEDVATVNEDGEVTFLSEGEGLIQVQVGSVKALQQFRVGDVDIEPRLLSLSLSDPEVELTDAYKHQRPSATHWFGTDHQNRDILSRVIHGTRDTLMIGFVSVAIGTVIGTFLGLIAGYYGGRLDSAITRMTDILLAFPGILLAIAVIAFLGAGLLNIILAVAVFTIPVFVRIVRAATLSLKEVTYVEAARSIGVRDGVIIARHILPGSMSVIMVYLTMRIGVAILIGAALSFLGLGGDITAPEWGSMLSAAKDNSGTVFHATFFPGLAIVITVLSFNIFGDGLRDALDPKLKE